MDITKSIEEKMQDAKSLTMIIYGLYAASFLVGITCIIAIIINYVKKDDVANTWLESHFRWQIRTFWFSVLWTIVGLITFVIFIGWFILAANCIWFIYRLVKGFIRLSENKPMYVD